MNLISITDLRQDATNILDKVNSSQEPVFIIQHSELKAVILDPNQYQTLKDAAEDYLDGLSSQKSLEEPEGTDINKYISQRWNHAGPSQTHSRKTTKSSAK